MPTSVRRFALVLLGSTLCVASIAGLAPDTTAVDPARELVISDASVVESPQETTFDPSRPSGTARQGAWSFGRLVHNMLPPAERDSPAAASQLVLNWLKTWESDQ